MKKYFLLAAVSMLFISTRAQVGINGATPWQFIKGDSAVPYVYPVYGEQGALATGSQPGARTGNASWTDANGNLWLFGGAGLSSSATKGYLNDLWKYDPITKQWKFIKGDNIPDVLGVYGIQGMPADENKPGARSGSVSWMDSDGNLWLFGGNGYYTSTLGALNDLWKYDPLTNQWTWIKGDNAKDVFGVYGNLGVPSMENKPGGRSSSMGWTDNAGNFWLFGGYGPSTPVSPYGLLNDLWKYNPTTNEWTWINGDSLTYRPGIYGMQGITSPNSKPGTRSAGAQWKDHAGNFWLFGGSGVGGLFTGTGDLNDLWRYNPVTNEWTWMKGDTTVFSSGVYGTQGVSAATNTPGVRDGSTAWKDANNNLWLYGGFSLVGGIVFWNDLWKYNITTNEWTWMKGDNTSNVHGVYGNLGVSAGTNKPGARSAAVGWKDAADNFWMFGGVVDYTLSNRQNFNDLWKYDPLTNNWTWVKGDSILDVTGVYGEQGYISEGNNPGARVNSVSWKDNSGNVWLFGGTGLTNPNNPQGLKNDLWKYDPLLDQWKWMKGDSIFAATGSYGSMGVAASTNKPGPRQASVTWTDPSGNLWLFGGVGFASDGYNWLSDLWKYDPLTNNWTWMKGDNTGGHNGVYGVQGSAAAGNNPGARLRSISWTDNAGNLWLFGGDGFAFNGKNGKGFLNDLWKYNTATNNWTWVKGDNINDAAGIYGTTGIEASGNMPGARYSSVTWTDAAGNLWLHGGWGFPASGGDQNLNDLWKYNTTTNNWTWMKGDFTSQVTGVYGTKGTEDAANKPGARNGAVSWKDGSDNLWLFGGYAYGLGTGPDEQGAFNDLWKYNIATNNWTWMKGANTPNSAGIFGTRLTGDAANNPTATWRSGVAQTDASGNFWLFGGTDNSANGEAVSLNTQLKYNTGTNEWTWVKGAIRPSNQGVFGTKGIAATGNKPGARTGAVSWADTAQNLWLFGGKDYADYLNDLWKYDQAIGQWTWIKGDSVKNTFAGVYGTLNSPAPGNKPGAREKAASWADSSGQLWLFGGSYAETGTAKRLNDLWKYDQSTNQWTWVKGDNTANATGVYGTVLVPATSNKPGARDSSITWTDRSGNLWLFGGLGYSTTSFAGQLSDLWKYDRLTNQWTFMKGNSSINSLTVYGTQGIEATTNKPGGRKGSVSWTDSSGKLWLFGGWGFNSTGTVGRLNDLWRYDPATNNWTWMKGDNILFVAGSYGTQGLSSSANKPGARESGIAWRDVYNNLWMSGGYGYGTVAGSTGYLNDLWKYNPATNEWTWIKGTNMLNAAGITTQPGARVNSIAWTDGYGDLWLFGGYGRGTSGTGYLNDLWKIFGGTRYVFTGTGNWNTASNWNGGVGPVAPTTITAGINVIIDHAIPGVCVNTGTIILKSLGRLKVESGKLLTIDQGGLLNGGFVQGPGNKPGKVLFTGNNLDTLISAASVITTPLILSSKNMILTGNTNTSTINLLGNISGRSNSGGTSTITLGNFNLNMDTAVLVANSYNFIITNGAGKLKRFVGSDPVTFHVGADVNSYTPVTIMPGSPGQVQVPFNDTFSVSVRPGVISAGSPAVPVTDSAVNRTWIIKKSTTGPGLVNLSVQWNLGDELPGFNRLTSYIAHKFVCPPPDPPNCSSSYYDAVPSSAATGNNPFIQSRNNVTGNFNNDSSFIVTSQSAEFRFINVNPNGVGDGNWNNPLNWTNLQVAPTTITAGMNVIIDPMVGNECIFTGTLVVEPGGKLTIGQGKKLTIRPF